MLPLLVGVGIAGLIGYVVVERLRSVGQQFGQSLAQGLAAGMTTVTVTTASSPALGQFGLRARDSLVLNVYPPPAGYVWKFAAGTGLVIGMASEQSATFAWAGSTAQTPPTLPAAPVSFFANLVKAGATSPPAATFTGTAVPVAGP